MTGRPKLPVGPDGLTDRQRLMLERLQACAALGEPSPTLPEMARALSRKPSWAGAALKRMQELGYVNSGYGLGFRLQLTATGAKLNNASKGPVNANPK